MPKFLYIIFCFLFVGQINAQQNGNYEFWVSSLDKASNDRLTYHVTSDSVTIKDGPYNFIYFDKHYPQDKLVFESILDKKAKMIFYKLGVTVKKDSLKLIYSNLCVMDGLILYFNFEWVDKKKNTTISNIYVAKMKPIVDFLNKRVPKKYQIHYYKKWLDKELKGCDKDLILD